VNRLPEYVEALEAALAIVEPMAATDNPPLEACGRRVLAEPVIADRDLPPFNRAQMDGYAVRAAEVGRVEAFPVVATISAGMAAAVAVPPGHCVKIATGAPLPDDVDSVVQHEHSDRGDPVRFTVDSIEPGHAVHPRGADAKAGDVLLAPPLVMRAQHLGIAAAVGKAKLLVTSKPRAIILSSGDEVVDVGAAVEPHQIRNSNGLMVAELLRRFGAEPLSNIHIADEREATIKAVAGAIKSANLVVTIGGVSAGERDHFPAAFDTCEVQRAVEGAAIQPGRPIVVGRTPKGVIILGLPGNPVSTLVCSSLFAWPMVRKMLGLGTDLPWRDIKLGDSVKPNPRRQAFRPARVMEDGTAVVPQWAGSGDLAHTANTSGLVALPVQEHAVRKGAVVRYLPWPW